MIIQIYEIQRPEEALRLIEMGVDHIGSVLLPDSFEKNEELFETIRLIQQYGKKSSLIPLFTKRDRILEALEEYHPDIIHFCDDISHIDDFRAINGFQKEIRQYFPYIAIQRAIPIHVPGKANAKKILDMARQLEETTDFFLTDTLPEPDKDTALVPQSGFVGITGQICDWHVAAQLVQKSRIPVILAGGLAPENVKEAILQTKPYGVDSCSATNIKDEKGAYIRFQKDMSAVEAFIQNARAVMGIDETV